TNPTLKKKPIVALMVWRDLTMFTCLLATGETPNYLVLGAIYAAATAISRQRLAQRRHAAAQSLQRAWWGAWSSQVSAQRSQISAHTRCSMSAEDESRLIHCAESAQMSAQSWQSLIQTCRISLSLWSMKLSASIPIISSEQRLQMDTHEKHDSMHCCMASPMVRWS